MGIERCLFCDTYLDASQKDIPSSRTEEHVFARWYRNAVVNKKIKMFTATLDLDSAPQLHRHLPLERFVNTGVCKNCNGGWMSTLETNVAPIVRRLDAGDDVNALSTKEVELLARWAGKTAVVLSHVTPQLARVPKSAGLSLHPASRVAPKMRFFYSKIDADLTLEGGYLQLVYGSELGLLVSTEVPATRITLCIYNHCLTVDFPPIVEGVSYDLGQSCSAMLWPARVAAGVAELNISAPAKISDVLLAICRSIHATIDPNVFKP